MNSLETTLLTEVMIVVGEAIAQLQLEHGMVVECVYIDSFMTFLDMASNPFPHIIK